MIGNVLTAGELALLRQNRHSCELYLTPLIGNGVWGGSVSAAPASDDRVYEISVATIADDIANVRAGMTALVGTTYGAWDIGIIRIRKDGTAGDTKLYIAETSEIDWQVGQFILVRDIYELWPKHPYLDPATEITYMDRDIAYADQHANCDPVPVMGPHRVLWLTGASVSTTFDASASWVLGSTIASHAWVAEPHDFVSIAGAATATPTFTFTGDYQFTIYDTVTATNGKTFTGVRYVMVIGTTPVTSYAYKVFELQNCSGDWEAGGWSFTVKMWDEAQTSEIRDRGLIILHAKDSYGGTAGSIGPVTGAANIVCVGYVVGESVTRHYEDGWVEFECQGAHYFLDQSQGFPTGVDDHAGAPTAWTEFDDLTTAKGLWHFLHWRTTATKVMDVIMTITSDTRQIASTYTPVGSLWEQITHQSYDIIFAKPLVNRLGQLYVEIDSQLESVATRATLPIVQTLTTQDWREEIGIVRRKKAECSAVDLSGVYWNGSITTALAIFSLSPGHIPKWHGRPERIERVALTNQAQADALAGCYLGLLNNEYPEIEIPLAPNNRAFDICPRQYGNLTFAAGDTPRGISFTNLKLVPRHIEYEHNSLESTLLVDATFEGESTQQVATTGDPPATIPDPEPREPPIIVVPPIQADTVVVMNKSQIGRCFDFFTAASPTWTSAITGLGAAGEFRHLAVSATGEAWLVTHAADITASGVFYCANIAGPVPSWTLVLSTQAANTAIGVDGSNCEFFGIACKSDGTVYTGLSAAYKGLVGDSKLYYWDGSAGSLTFKNYACTLFPAFPRPAVGSGNFVFNCQSGTPYVGISGNADYAGGYMNLATGAYVSHTIANADRSCVATSSSFGASSGNGNIYPFGAGWDVASYANANGLNGLYEIDGSLYWVRATDDHLMLGANSVAVATTVFGVGKVSGGFKPIASHDEVIWVAFSPAPTVAIAHTLDGGANWLNKTGNWATAIGAWAGGDGSDSIPCVDYSQVTY